MRQPLRLLTERMEERWPVDTLVEDAQPAFNFQHSASGRGTQPGGEDQTPDLRLVVYRVRGSPSHAELEYLVVAPGVDFSHAPHAKQRSFGLQHSAYSSTFRHR